MISYEKIGRGISEFKKYLKKMIIYTSRPFPWAKRESLKKMAQGKARIIDACVMEACGSMAADAGDVSHHMQMHQGPGFGQLDSASA